jgi:NADH-quinone oxidoreductase subunit M
MYKQVMHGETNALTATFTDISGTEVLALGIICVLIIAIGIYPQPILHISEAAVTKLVQTMNLKFDQVKP